MFVKHLGHFLGKVTRTGWGRQILPHLFFENSAKTAARIEVPTQNHEYIVCANFDLLDHKVR